MTLWTPQRARLWLAACAIAAFLPILGMPLRRWLDFSAFYAAGSLAFTPQVTGLEPILRFQLERGLPPTPFVYPAGVALVYAPFAALPYDLAAILHTGLMLGALVLAARLGADLLGLPRGWTILGALAWGPAAAGVVSGQNTSLALLLVALAAHGLVRGRDALAGGATALLTYKPQLAAPMAGLLLLRGRWAALGLVALAVPAHYLLGVLATGGDLVWPQAWLATLLDYSDADFRANGWQAVSLPALGTRLELVTGLPLLTVAGFVLGGLLVLASLPALRRWPPVEAVAIACAAGLVVSPHAWVYDATLLLPAVAVIAARAARRGWPHADRWLLAAAYAIAVTWPLGGFVGLTLVPLLVVAAPLVLLRGAPSLSPAPRPAPPG